MPRMVVTKALDGGERGVELIWNYAVDDTQQAQAAAQRMMGRTPGRVGSRRMAKCGVEAWRALVPECTVRGVGAAADVLVANEDWVLSHGGGGKLVYLMHPPPERSGKHGKARRPSPSVRKAREVGLVAAHQLGADLLRSEPLLAAVEIWAGAAGARPQIADVAVLEGGEVQLPHADQALAWALMVVVSLEEIGRASCRERV